MAAATAGSEFSSNYDKIKEIKEFDQTKIGVKGLVDSGVTSIPKIFIHPPETLSTIKPTQTKATIPLIDLQNLKSPAHRPKIVEEIKEAAKSWGFFQIVNHGVPISVIDRTIEAVKTFHELPIEVKSKYYNRKERPPMIYSSNNDLYRSRAASWHDYFQIWMSPEEKKAKIEEIPEVLRNMAPEWDLYAIKVGEDVMELLCEGLGLEAGKFKELTFSEERILVGVYYPYCPQPDLTVGLTSHTDPGALTVLLQNQLGGLQVKHEDYWWM